MGGAACIRQTRISVWILVSLSQQGVDDAELMEDYSNLTLLDLWAAQTYYKANRQEIDDLIIANNLEDLPPTIETIELSHTSNQPSEKLTN